MKYFISDFLNYYLLYIIVLCFFIVGWFLVYGITLENPLDIFHEFCAGRNYAFVKSMIGVGILTSFINSTFYPMTR